MNRRTLLRLIPFPALRGWSQDTSFPGQQESTLRELAAVVLPSELGGEGTDHVVGQFIRWVKEYRPGTDMEHGYGFTRVRSKPASPAPTYMKQLASLREPLDAATNVSDKRKVGEEALGRANIRDLPAAPDGKHIVSDLMSFYFRSSDANDLCYRAAIRRDACRGLDGSDNPPPPLKGIA